MSLSGRLKVVEKGRWRESLRPDSMQIQLINALALLATPAVALHVPPLPLHRPPLATPIRTQAPLMNALPPNMYSNIRGDLRTRPISSAIALAACGMGGATLGLVLWTIRRSSLGFEFLLIGSAVGWSAASLGDRIAEKRQLKREAELKALEAEMPLLREEELNEAGDARLRGEVNARFNRLFNS